MPSIPAFHEVVFPEDISYGSSGGATFSTTIIQLTSGFEQRNINWSDTKAEYEATQGIKMPDQMQALIDFFYARRGKAYGFRYKDWSDYTIEDGVVAQFDGTTGTVQLNKRYEPQTSYFFDRPIKKFVPDSLEGNFYTVLNGVRTDLAPGRWTLDYTTGIWATLDSIPPVGTSLFVEYIEFHVPCRFDTDMMKVSHDDWETQSWPSIPIVELKLP